MTRIAVVEDNEDNRLLLEALLEDRFTVDEYEDGRSGLEGIQVTPPDLVLLDIALPQMDGPAVLAALRENERTAHIPVIALTAHAMDGDRERFMELGFDAYVTKPIVDEEELFSAINRLIGDDG